MNVYRRITFFLCSALCLQAAPYISEFMASNDSTLSDEDGEFPDWIEVHNPDSSPVTLAGWTLTDDPSSPAKWTFPAVTIPAGEYLVVFASQKDRSLPGFPLHTNFKLSASGEYLALLRPDQFIATEFNPAYPPQTKDISYGFGGSVATPVNSDSSISYLIPHDNSLGQSWTTRLFDDSSWNSQTPGGAPHKQGIGYENSPASGTSYTSELSTILPSGTTSTYLRIPFEIPDASLVDSLTLKLKYDDGFVAYLDGISVASDRIPDPLEYNSSSTGSHPDSLALQFISFDLTPHIGDLVTGTNVLAFHHLNDSPASSDYLLSAELHMTGQIDPLSTPPGYQTTPTPNGENNSVSNNGPRVSDLTENPTPPTSSTNQIITAKVAPKTDPISRVDLYYRVNYDGEAVLPMNDAGINGDATPNDGLWSASIPSSAYTSGEMLRWYVIAADNSSNTTRTPASLDAQAPEYHGTGIDDGITSNGIKRFRWWVQNPDWYWTGNVGSTIHKKYTFCSILYDGIFYDNARVRTRGGSSVHLEYDKQSLHFNFHSSTPFHWIEGSDPADRVNLNSQWVDQVFMRNHLSMHSFAEAGVNSAASDMVLVHQFGSDPQVSNLIEHPNDEYLDRHELDPDGALYKIYNRLANANNRPAWSPGVSPNSLVGVEKKTRTHENNSDLQSFISGLSDSFPNRETHLFDNANLPSLINYMAASVIDNGLDVFAKNNFLYRDTNGTGEWQMFPWDRDVAWGPTAWNQNAIIWNHSAKSHPLFGSGINGGERYPLFEAIIDTPLTRQMFLRRLRTIMDEQLPPPGTPFPSLILETLIDDFVTETERFSPPAGQSDNWVQRDKDLWGKLRMNRSGSELQSFDTAVNIIKTTYLANRRNYLYNTQGPTGTGLIPNGQSSAPTITIGMIDFNPTSTNQDEEFIEIINPNSDAIDISGWTISNAVTHTIPKGTVIPAMDASLPLANRLYLSPNPKAFRSRSTSPTSGESRFVQGPYSGHLSNFGETIELSNPSGALVDGLTYTGTPSPAQLNLIVSEIMYHPAGNPDAEYLELSNISDSETLDLTGLKFTDGILFDFTGSSITSLAPGQQVLVVKDPVAFEAIYGASKPVAGIYTGSLDNDGEIIKLEDASNSTILEFTYNDSSPWPLFADGTGASLVLNDPSSRPDPELSTSWRNSSFTHGTPGNLPTPGNPPPANPHDDLNNNGQSDLIDWAISGHPVIGFSDDHLTISFNQNLSSTPLSIKIQQSDDLSTWLDTNTGVFTQSYNNDGTATITYRTVAPASSKPSQFLRLIVTTL